jgi:hypothetical protein
MTKEVNNCKIYDCDITGFHDTMMITVFWDVIPCNQLELTDVSEEHTAFISRDEGSTFLRNGTVSHLRR